MFRLTHLSRSPFFSIVAILGCTLLPSAVVRADPISLDFSSLGATSQSTLEGDSYNQIHTLMLSNDTTIANSINASLPAGASVTVGGALIVNDFNGEGHVVGPRIGSNNYSWTLGDTSVDSNTGNLKPPTVAPSGYSSFIANAGYPFGNPVSSGITMTFSSSPSNSFLISQVSFDFEIFPDGTGNRPDLTFSGTNNGNAVSISSVAATIYQGVSYTGSFGSVGSVSDATWTALGNTPNSNTLTGSGFHYSPLGYETSQQLLGTATITFSSPVDALSFQDWPAMIGVSNLQLTPFGPGPRGGTAPAPPSVVLLGFGGLGLAFLLARSRRRLAAA